MEESLKGLGVPYAIIRPTLTFGRGDLLLNNMAWALRRFPFFPICGNGKLPGPNPYTPGGPGGPGSGCRFQSREQRIRRCGGRRPLSFEALLRLIASSMGAPCRLVHTPPSLGLTLTRFGRPDDAWTLCLPADEVDGPHGRPANVRTPLQPVRQSHEQLARR